MYALNINALIFRIVKMWTNKYMIYNKGINNHFPGYGTDTLIPCKSTSVSDHIKGIEESFNLFKVTVSSPKGD